MSKRRPATEAVAVKGIWKAFRFLWLRRLMQLSILGLFVAGPVLGVWLISGNLSSSLILGKVPMSDPLAVLQSLLAGHPVVAVGVIGAGLVIALYALTGGRSFCSWVCPVNMITDLAAWLRRRLGIRTNHRLPRKARYWLLALVLALPVVTEILIWEFINPISLVYRGLLFGLGAGWYLLAAIFLFDLLVTSRGWCGHLCPLGAFYGLAGKYSPLIMSAARREKCDDCMDCYAVCPEPQILPMALKPKKGFGPVLKTLDCTRCGRCLDVCAKDVFEYQVQLKNQHPLIPVKAVE
ncbi:quinol dehydrogenase ferredoxin subunit NapH [Spongorhabdus nitratireducens]